MKSFARRSWVFVFIAVFPILAAAQTAQDFIKQGDAKGAAGDIKGSIAAYTRAITADPKSVEAWVARGFAKESSGDTAGAFADYGQAHTADPASPLPFQYSSKLKFRTGDLEGALADANGGIEAMPLYDALYPVRGDIYLATGKYDEALADYRKYMELQPRKPERGYYGIARALLAQKNFEGAEDAATQCLKLVPKSAEAYFLRAQIRAAAGDTDGAMADASEIIRLYPKAAAGYGLNALLNLIAGDSTNAIADGNRAVEVAPKDPQGYLIRALSLTAAGKYEKALGDYRTAVRITPALGMNTDTSTMIFLLGTRVEGQKLDDTEFKWRPDPKGENFYSQTALFLIGQLGEKDYLAIIKKTKGYDEGKHAEALFYTGMSHLNHGEKPEAGDAFRKCLVVANKEKDLGNHALLAKSELARLDSGDTQPVPQQNPPVSQQSVPVPHAPAPPADESPAAVARAGFGKTIAEVEAYYGKPVKKIATNDPDVESREYDFGGTHFTVEYWKGKVAYAVLRKTTGKFFSDAEIDAMKAAYSEGATWTERSRYEKTGEPAVGLDMERSDNGAYGNMLLDTLSYSFTSVPYAHYRTLHKVALVDTSDTESAAPKPAVQGTQPPANAVPLTRVGFGKTVAEAESVYGKPVTITPSDDPDVEQRNYVMTGVQATVEYWKGRVAGVELFDIANDATANKENGHHFPKAKFDALMAVFSDGRTWKSTSTGIMTGEWMRSDKGARAQMASMGELSFYTTAYLDYKTAHSVDFNPRTDAQSKASTPAQKKAAKLAESGRKKYQAGDFDGGSADIEKALALDPNNAVALTGRGDIKIANGEDSGDPVDYNKAIAADPKYAPAYVGRGEWESDAAERGGNGSAGLYDRAISDYSKAIQLDPDSFGVYTLRARAKAARGDTKGAVADLDKELENNPNNTQAADLRKTLLAK